MKLPKKQERKLQELHFTISYPVQKTLPLQITYFTKRKCGCMVNAFSSGKLAYSRAYHVTMVLFNFIVHICSSSPCLNNGTHAVLSMHLQDIFAHVHPDIQVIIVKVRIYLYFYFYLCIPDEIFQFQAHSFCKSNHAENK